MSLVYPLAMPSVGPSTQTFEVQRVDYMSPEASGRLGGVQAGQALWAASWDLGTLSRAQSDEWRAFVAALRGQQKHFLGRDFERPRPKAYVGGLPGGFDACSGWYQSFDAEGTARLELDGLPAGLQLTRGDYVGFRWTTGGSARRAMVRSLEAVTATGGGQATFAVDPPVPALVPSGAAAHLEMPTCLMKLDARQSKAASMSGRRNAVTGTLNALQDLVP